MLAAEGIESHDATEEDGHVVVAFSRDGPFVSQLVGNRWRQNGIEQSSRGRREMSILSEVYLWCTRAAE